MRPIPLDLLLPFFLDGVMLGGRSALRFEDNCAVLFDVLGLIRGRTTLAPAASMDVNVGVFMVDELIYYNITKPLRCTSTQSNVKSK